MKLIKTITIILLLFTGIVSTGQNNELDSLRLVLGEMESDSSRMQILIEMANECRYYYPEDLRRYNQQALQLAEKNDYSLGEGLALKGMGKYFYDMGQYDSADYYYNRAELVFRGMDDKKELLNILADYCYVCVAQGEYNKALDAGLSALQMAEEIGNEPELQNANAFLGFTYHSSGDKEEALKYLFTGLEIAQNRNDIKGVATIKRDIAIVYDDYKDYDLAIKYYSESADLLKQLNDNRSLGIAMFNIAEAYRCQGDFNNAIIGFYDSYQLVTKLNDVTGKTLLLLKLAKTYIDMQKNGLALIKANQIIHQAGYSDIDNLLMSSAKQLEKNNNKNDLLTNFKLLVELNKLNGNYEKAYYYNNELIVLIETLSQLNTANALAKMLNRFEMQQKEKELELIEAQNMANEEKITLQRQLQLIIIIVTVLLVIFGFMLRSRIRTIRRTKEEILEKNKQIEKEKLRAEKSEKFKEQFLANVSHEIRTPMNAIMGITNIIIKNNHLKEQEKYLDAINISARHLLGLINDILNLSKLEAGKYEVDKTPFRVDVIFDRVKSELNEAAIQKGLQFIFRHDDQLPEHLLGDQYMLQQTLINLCRNAIEYTEKGRVDVDCRLNGKTENLAILGFTVKDTGIGIDKELHDKIFNSFIGEVSFDRKSFSQSGLELVIIRQMLELQGGNITLDSQPGVGTTFYFEIPYEINLDKDFVESDSPVTVKEISDISELKILLVEDNEFNVMVAKDELEDALRGVWVDVAENGQVAIEKITKRDYNVVLMDIQMPVMNGYDATKAIRKMENNKSNIPIIAMTANNLKSEVDKCYAAGMNAYVPKPFETDELILRIKENLKS